MKYIVLFSLILFSITRCSNELVFEYQNFVTTTTLPCKKPCPTISLKIPIAKEVPIAADSINKKVFSVLKKIIYFGEKPYTASNYKELTTAFIGSYEKFQNDFPNDTFGWEAQVEESIKYKSENILNYKSMSDHQSFGLIYSNRGLLEI
ncbi:hypothetical protein EKL99_07680 [Flavobacterium sp. ZB4P23]|uniref:hypothetical protein n=1 Tax=Flavobacterium sp. ZB4P23 TaxID=2497484 RepID=UPI000F8165A3|nr:hypothetical protein [Flavobacterium sp. ZB4P23]RTY82579.1 hypothetical protein EKL99_07680 [Flavobacterium sp. ZB4P23]